MCGLIGIINKKWDTPLPVYTESIFKQLLFANALRGMDGTGIFKITKDHSVELHKKGTSSYFFLGDKDTKNIIDNYYKDSFAIFGHNRKATIGGTGHETAHPFKEDNVTLIHNGTLTSFPRTNNILSDSHYISTLFSKEKDEKQVLESLEGAYALIWHNKERKQINIARNEERPLYILETEKHLILVSEEEMGLWILSRNGIDVIRSIEVEAGYLYKYSFKKKLNLVKIKFTPKEKRTVITHVYNAWTNVKNALFSEEEENYTPHYQGSNHYGKTLTVIPETFIPVVQNSNIYVHNNLTEVTGKIIAPPELANKTFVFTCQPKQISGDVLDKTCECEYSYCMADSKYKVNNLRIKKEPQTPILLTNQVEEGTKDWTYITKNGFEVNEYNYDDIAECKCNKCNKDFSFTSIDDLEECFIKERKNNPNEKYKYICKTCYNNVVPLQNRQHISPIIVQPDNSYVH